MRYAILLSVLCWSCTAKLEYVEGNPLCVLETGDVVSCRTSTVYIIEELGHDDAGHTVSRSTNCGDFTILCREDRRCMAEHDGRLVNGRCPQPND